LNKNSKSKNPNQIPRKELGKGEINPKAYTTNEKKSIY